MLSKKSLIRLMVAVLALAPFLMSSCSGKKSEEQIAEKIIKESTGKDAEVKMREGKIEIEGKDFKSEMSETTVWPPDMFNDVPEFTFGKIERVHKSTEETGMRKFNIYFVDVEHDALDKYADALKKNGWQASVMQMGDKGGMLTAEKGELALNFPFSVEKKSGTLVVYSIPR
ncbi:MAG: hypothetical protein WBW16_15125 [Bacteroidota bacterium]